MAASDNLSDAQFYHGTYAGWLRKGSNILPAIETGNQNFGLSSPHHVYMTTDPEKARWYAEQTYKNLEANGFKIGNTPIFGAKPVVYRVSPIGHVEEDPNSDTPGVHWRAKKAKITGRE